MNKLLHQKPQLLVNKKLSILKNNLASYLLRDVELDELKVKHFEVTSKNTLTTPKIIITNSSTDPVNNGEITRNGTTIKAKTGGIIKNFGGTLVKDTDGTGTTENTVSNTNVFTKGITTPSTAYSTKASTTITVAKDNSVVVVAGYVVYMTDRNAGVTAYGKILDGTSVVIPEVTKSLGKYHCKAIFVKGVITAVSSGSHTYKIQGKLSVSGSGTEGECGAEIYAGVVKLR